MLADIIINRNAGGLREGSGLRDTLVTAAQGRAHVHETRSLEQLNDAARRIAMRGTRAVVLAGGDGSCMAGVSALARAFAGELPPLALVPAGTVCTVASNWAGRRRVGRARAWAERIVRAAAGDAPRLLPRPTLRVTDDAGADRVGFIFGAGLVARFFEAYCAGGAPGLTRAAQLAARALVGSFAGSAFAERMLSPAACSLEVDGSLHPARAWSLVLASVVRDVGLHVRATYRGGEALDRFHLVASGLPARALGRQVPRVVAGRPMTGEPRVDTLAGVLRVSFAADESGAYVLDGDIFHAQAVHVGAGPVVRWVVAP